MKNSIKTFRLFSMAALALVMAACSSNDDMIQQQTAQPQGKKMHFTATIEAPNSTTRTVYTPDKDANNKDIIKVAWKEGDEIALIHGGVKDVVTIGTPNADGSAPISGDITVGANDETVVLAYPAAAVYSATPYGTFPFTPNPTCWDKAHAQDGTLEFIQNNIDFRMGSGKLSVSGDPATASLKESVKMPSMISIWKLTLQDNTSAALSATAVKVKANGELVAGATSTAKSAYYLCMVPSFIPEGDLVIEATVGSDTYTYTKAGGVSLTVGKFYQSTVTLTKPATGHALSASAVGEVVGTDGLAYAVADKDNLPTGVSAAGMVAYKNGSNGLVIALSDDGTMDWSTANGATTGAAAHTPAVTGQTWKLPSQAEWQQMFSANGGSQSSYTGLNTALAAAGGDSSKLQDGDDYWSSTETEINGEQAFAMWLLSYNGSVYSISAAKVDNPNPVRACFAF
jgi:hypothetical protein